MTDTASVMQCQNALVPIFFASNTMLAKGSDYGPGTGDSSAMASWSILTEDKRFTINGTNITCNKAGTYTIAYSGISYAYGSSSQSILRLNGNYTLAVGDVLSVYLFVSSSANNRMCIAGVRYLEILPLS